MADQRDVVQDIVAKALQFGTPDARAAFLHQACGGDDALFTRANSMCEQLGSTTTNTERNQFLDATAGFDSATLPFETVGSRIGPYELIRKLGAGGFGAVYLAHQQQPVRRDVALKIIKVGMDTQHVIARFQAESQALALMDHPGIAKVYDVGVTDTGRPYFVMELVKGDVITGFCDDHRFNTVQRLELFISVCKAIHHAHQKGVVHRDIKPSNVLVTEHDGLATAKIIDFGIAKATQEPLTDQVIHTAQNELIGTPRYMSPEQAGGRGDIDHRSDIYALGLLLYELLTGHAPFFEDQQENVPWDEILRVIRKQDAVKPSTLISELGDRGKQAAASRTTDVATLRRTLRGDLDWIVMKCLEKDPNRRYQAVSELADDIGRYIHNEPVLAGPPSIFYRVSKYCVRRRGLLIAAGLVLAALCLGAVASIFSLYQARQREHDLARLADVQLLDDLRDEFEVLAEVDYRMRRQAMENWLERMKGLLSRRPTYEAALATLRASAGRRPVDVETSPVATQWSFADPAQQEYHNVLTRFLQQLDSLQVPDGCFAQVESWIARTPTESIIAEAWSALEQSHSAQSARPTIDHDAGLYPLGPNSTSGLWEFVDLSTGLAPDRSANGQLSLDASTGIIYVLLPPGDFRMGSSPDEQGRKPDETLHDVSMSSLLISKFEITQSQWMRVMHENPSQGVGPLNPVERVTWSECQEFCRRTHSQLPSEAQWEYACRAGDSGPFSGTLELDEVGWYRDNSGKATHAVGQKAANRFGLFDMHGNVLEWCQDVYSTDFYDQPEARVLDPLNGGASESSERRVLRGGSFEGLRAYCRSADRYKDFPEVRHGGVGFRTVRPVLGRRGKQGY